MFGIVNPTAKYSGEAYAALVAEAGDKPAVDPASKPFGGALIDNPGDGDTASQTAPVATGAFTTSVDEPGDAVPTAADSIPGSIETAQGEDEGSGALVSVPVAGFAAAMGVALLLA